MKDLKDFKLNDIVTEINDKFQKKIVEKNQKRDFIAEAEQEYINETGRENLNAKEQKGE